jgi:polyisoprenoid-binding protein YceI
MKWEIDPAHSSANFKVKHMGIAFVHGSITGVTGEINFVPENPGEASFSGKLDISTVTTGHEKRDGHLKGEEFFDVENYPEAEFESKEVEVESDTESEVKGDLTIRDKTEEVELEVEFNGVAQRPDGSGNMDDVAAFTIEAEIDRTDFGLDWNMELPGDRMMVGNKVQITVEVEAIKQS